MDTPLSIPCSSLIFKPPENMTPTTTKIIKKNKIFVEVPKSISLRGAVGAPQWNTIRILVNQLRFVPQEAGSTNIAEYF